MESTDTEAIRLLLERAGLTLTDEELEKLIPYYQRNLERLQALHSADLEKEEVAGVFPPQWSAD